jgi:hypothetical protein
MRHVMRPSRRSQSSSSSATGASELDRGGDRAGLVAELELDQGHDVDELDRGGDRAEARELGRGSDRLRDRLRCTSPQRSEAARSVSSLTSSIALTDPVATRPTSALAYRPALRDLRPRGMHRDA